MSLHRRIFQIICVIVVIVVFSYQARYTSAQDGEQNSQISVLDQSFVSNYRESVTYRLKASSSAGQIVAVKLYQRPISFNDNVVTIRDFVPGQEIEIEYVQDTLRFPLAPFETIYYRWEISDDAGNVLRTPETTALLTDTSHPWQTLSDGKVAVYWYNQDETFGQNLLAAAQSAYERFTARIGMAPKDEIRLLIYNTINDMCVVYPPNQCQQHHVEALPAQLFGNVTAIVPGDRYALVDAISHGMALTIVTNILDMRNSRVPLWFNAAISANNAPDMLDALLRRAQASGSANALLSQRELMRMFGRFGGPDDAAYFEDWLAQVASMGVYLFEQYGADSAAKILVAIQEGKQFREAFSEATGVQLDDFFTGWRAWLGAPPVTATPAQTPLPTLTIELRPSPTYPPTITPKP